MKSVLKLTATIALGIFTFYACGNKEKVLESPSEIADAIRKKDINAIYIWLKNGGNPNQAIEGQSPLYIATGPKGSLDIVKLLLNNGANVNQGSGKYTPLMNAASWVNLKAVNLLLEKGADKNLVNEKEEIALDLIGDCGNCPEQIQLKKILKRG